MYRFWPIRLEKILYTQAAFVLDAVTTSAITCYGISKGFRTPGMRCCFRCLQDSATVRSMSFKVPHFRPADTHYSFLGCVRVGPAARSASVETVQLGKTGRSALSQSSLLGMAYADALVYLFCMDQCIVQCSIAIA